ncbi:C45 family peptidase [Flammeovirga kamogawensis]|uniref:Linear amide C-N hydrolase n=1 Tax=Flammeovirga kamogawensis TaxID=373891 RepID=A0ABX8H494_9BACT|nr:hypothetical protein [Flammeovirga kamogawensis]MBB6461810.1 hypothetical protein [Flammeovirga kamogawensis]QWG10726.1 hypothetical protein KM029_25415 [Flammeovirga kamogawensis]TRX63828.1 hypothetical protein EO216_25785 [Flammeovirga kamogawensis]
MKKFILSLALSILMLIVGVKYSNAQVAGDNLDYFNAQRQPVQTTVEVIDFTDKTDYELAEYLSKIDRDTVPSEVLEQYAAVVENNRKIAPEYVAMMEIQAKLRGVDVVQLFAEASYVDVEVSEYGKIKIKQALKGCTSMAFNNGIVGQNNDMGIDFLEGAPTVMIRTKNSLFIPTDGAHFQGMGEHVGIVLNTIIDLESGTTLGKDNIVSTDAVFAMAVQCKSADEFLEKIKGFGTPSPINFTIADDQGNHYAVRLFEDRMEVANHDDRGSYSANHTQATKDAILKKFDIYTANSYTSNTFAREEAARSFLKYSPELTVGAMQHVFSVRPINISKDAPESTFVTVQTMIFDVANGVAYITPDNPRFVEYTKIELNTNTNSK